MNLFRKDISAKVIYSLLLTSMLIVTTPIAMKFYNEDKSSEIVDNSYSVCQDDIGDVKLVIRADDISNVSEISSATKPLEFESYRLTSYTPDDGTVTGSGYSIHDFEVNEKGWYTWNDMIVVSTATKELLDSGEYGFSYNENIRYYNYYDMLMINIDGNYYKAIVLDSCGASMIENDSDMGNDRIDLFASNSDYTIDRGYNGSDAIGVAYLGNYYNS